MLVTRAVSIKMASLALSYPIVRLPFELLKAHYMKTSHLKIRFDVLGNSGESKTASALPIPTYDVDSQNCNATIQMRLEKHHSFNSGQLSNKPICHSSPPPPPNLGQKNCFTSCSPGPDDLSKPKASPCASTKESDIRSPIPNVPRKSTEQEDEKLVSL